MLGAAEPNLRELCRNVSNKLQVLKILLFRTRAHSGIDDQVKLAVEVARVNAKRAVRQADHELLIHEKLVELDEETEQVRKPCLGKDSRNEL